MANRRSIGLHLRYEYSLSHMLDEAKKMQIDAVQFFLRMPKARDLIVDQQSVIAVREQYAQTFTHQFVHASYWINLANELRNGYHFFEKELFWSQALGTQGLILHPGSARQSKSKDTGIKRIVTQLDRAMKRIPEGKVILENTAHGHFSIGSDLADLATIYQLVTYPERLFFALDTAHAFVYGYELSHFLDVVGSTIGFDRIVVIHLNDSLKKLGSQEDIHAAVGTGLIGEQALRVLVTDARVAHVPIIMEPPVMSVKEQVDLVSLVRSWS